MEAKRLFIGGLFHGITPDHLLHRFSHWGSCKNIQIVNHPDGKTFAYIDIEITPESLKKCQQLYNKSKWKGNLIRIQEAKKSYQQKLAEEWKHQKLEASIEKNKIAQKNQQINKQKRKLDTLVTDANVDGKPGWKRSRFGRAVFVLKINIPGKSRITTVDPSKFKTSLTKLTGDPIDKPISELSLDLGSDSCTDSDDEIEQLQGGEQVEKELLLNQESKLLDFEEKDDQMEVQGEQPNESSEVINFDDFNQANGEIEDIVGEIEPTLSKVNTETHTLTTETKEETDGEMEDAEEIHDKLTTIDQANIVDDTSTTTITPNETSAKDKSSKKTSDTYQVNVNLKSLVSSSSQGFSLFGSTSKADDAQEEEEEDPVMQKEVAEPTVIENFSTSKLFFFHMDNPALKSRSLYDESVCFKRTLTPDEITQEWDAKKQDLTNEFKRKYKSEGKAKKRSHRKNKIIVIFLNVRKMKIKNILPSKNILLDLYQRKKVTLNPTQLVSLVQLSIDSLSKDGLSFIDEHKIIQSSKGNLQNLTVIGNTLTKYSPEGKQIGINLLQLSMTQGDLEAAFIYSQLTNSNSILNQLATEKKYPPAQFLLGSELFKTDQPRAVELIRKAADGGLASACFQMARFYANGVLEKNLEKSVHYAKLASKKYHLEALFLLGGYYIRGEGTEKDLDKGMKCYMAAANGGLAVAQHNMACIILESITPNNPLRIWEVIEYWKMASEMKFPLSCINLGKLYMTGFPNEGKKVVRVDLDAARVYLEKVVGDVQYGDEAKVLLAEVEALRKEKEKDSFCIML